MNITYVQALWNHILHIDVDGETTLCGWNWGSSQWNTLKANAGSIEVCAECTNVLEGSA